MDAAPGANEDVASRPVGVALSSRYLRELESLRGWAILQVMVFHADATARWTGVSQPGVEVSLMAAFAREGCLGVTLFFVLSAFLLSRPYFESVAAGRRISLRGYARRRALRILPLFWTAVLVAAIAVADSPRDLLRAPAHMLFLQPFGWTEPLHPWSDVWWSLATEVQFYAVLPLLGWALAAPRRRFAAGAALVAYLVAFQAWQLGWLSHLGGDAPLRLAASAFGRGPNFLAGIAAAALYVRFGDGWRRRLAGSRVLRNGGADLALAALLALLGLHLQWGLATGIDRILWGAHQWYLVVEGALLAAILLSLLLLPLRAKALFVNGAMDRIGLLSYSAYLVHLPVYALAFRLFDALGAGPSLALGVGWTTAMKVAMPLAMAACLGVSALTYRWIELPFLRRKEGSRSV